MLGWHDCKTDLPKKSGFYLLVYSYNDGYGWERTFDRAIYSTEFYNWSIFENERWQSLMFIEQGAIPIKWAEVDLSEVE